MTRDHILAEIRRITLQQGGKPPGREVFERETGIKQSEWYPALWLRWGEALSEAVVAQTRFRDESKTLPSFGNMLSSSANQEDSPWQASFG